MLLEQQGDGVESSQNLANVICDCSTILKFKHSKDYLEELVDIEVRRVRNGELRARGAGNTL